MILLTTALLGMPAWAQQQRVTVEWPEDAMLIRIKSQARTPEELAAEKARRAAAMAEKIEVQTRQDRAQGSQQRARQRTQHRLSMGVDTLYPVRSIRMDGKSQANGIFTTDDELQVTWELPTTDSEGNPIDFDDPNDIAGYHIAVSGPSLVEPHQYDVRNPRATAQDIGQFPVGEYETIVTSYDASGNNAPSDPPTVFAVFEVTEPPPIEPPPIKPPPVKPPEETGCIWRWSGHLVEHVPPGYETIDRRRCQPIINGNGG